MAHLRSYKSFNLDEIEEIESRIFCPIISADENTLKCCPGSTNIPNINYESTLGTLYKRQIGSEEHNAKIWEDLKNNILNVLHHAKHQADPMVVHLNERFIDNDDLDFFDDISVCGFIDGQEINFAWTKHSPNAKSEHLMTRTSKSETKPKTQILLSPQNVPETRIASNDICSRIFSLCFCRNRKDN